MFGVLKRKFVCFQKPWSRKWDKLRSFETAVKVCMALCNIERHYNGDGTPRTNIHLYGDFPRPQLNDLWSSYKPSNEEQEIGYIIHAEAVDTPAGSAAERFRCLSDRVERWKRADTSTDDEDLRMLEEEERAPRRQRPPRVPNQGSAQLEVSVLMLHRLTAPTNAERRAIWPRARSC